MLALVLLHSRGGFKLTIVAEALIWLNSFGGFNTVEKLWWAVQYSVTLSGFGLPLQCNHQSTGVFSTIFSFGL
jgi:hypothetical protein